MPNENNWTLYSNNHHAWQAILSDCQNAQKSIHIEQFIFTNDEFGKKLISICKERAKSGVEVKFLWDAAGSFTLWGTELVEELRKNNVQLLFWKTLIPGYFKIPKLRFWFFRNHRRSIIIDNNIGYTGSICISDYFKNWRDTNVRITGPVVDHMTRAFLQMWARAQNKRPERQKRQNRYNEFRYLTNYPAPGRRRIYSEIIRAMRNARDHIYITVPYFVPTHRLLRTIKGALKRGVDVQIILPEKSDHYLVDLGAQSYFTTLLKAGAKIFLYSGNMIHSKAITIDDTWSTVGSMNLDSVSLLYNFESNIVTTNNSFANTLKQHFQEDLHETRQVIMDEWKKRSFTNKIMTFFVHFIKKVL